MLSIFCLAFGAASPVAAAMSSFSIFCLAFGAASPVAAAADALTATVTPWCDNSFRMKITFDKASAAVTSQRATLATRLASEELAELPGAFDPNTKCAPGKATVLSSTTAAVAAGYLEMSLTADGAVRAVAKDTGAVLFTLATTFTEPPPPPPPPSPSVCAAAQPGVDQTGGKLISTLENQTTTTCCAACIANKDCDVWALASQTNQKYCYLVHNPSGTKSTPSGPTYRVMGVARNSSGGSGGGPHTPPGFYAIQAVMSAGDEKGERVYGMGQGNWTCDGGCATGCPQVVVPLARNGQTIELLQRKFHVTIPFAYSTGSGGYGVLMNMFGYGHAAVGKDGGMVWNFDAALELDMWITAAAATPASGVGGAPSVYEQYADATGHAPMLREDAMIFWQSRNRYKSSRIAMEVANRYAELKLPVGVIVIDYKNQNHDGDFAPGPTCFPNVSALSSGIRAAINATTVFSFWPEVKTASNEYGPLKAAGCLINSALGGLAIDATIEKCRTMIWSQYLKPRYYDQGVNAYWLDETDGEGTAGGDVPGGDCDANINDCGGYQTSFGPAVAYSNLWVNQWLKMYSDPVAELKEHLPLVLTRGVWAGGQRHGIVLWSSDIESTFAELTSQVPQGVHASLSGIPWWTTDVGGYGCGSEQPNDSAYMQELIVRWYQFGCFSPVFRTHGHRAGEDPDKTVAPCNPKQNSGGANEVWSYGTTTQVILEKYVKLRATIKPYIQELAENVTKFGVPTMRPLWYEFPDDEGCVGINDQYFLGPTFLVAPVTTQGSTTREMYFPKGASWKNIFDGTIVAGGAKRVVRAPLDQIPVYERQ